MALLDTTVVIDWMREAKRRIAGPATAKLNDLLARQEPLRVAIFTLGELYVGVGKGSRSTNELAAVEAAMSAFDVMPFEASTARIFGVMVGQLEKRGVPISDMDALIASVAIELNEVLVTRNLKHFARLPRLVFEGY